jgi:hypothetical protein
MGYAKQPETLKAAPWRLPLGVTRKLPGRSRRRAEGRDRPAVTQSTAAPEPLCGSGGPEFGSETAIRTCASGQFRSEESIEIARRSPGTRRSQPPLRASSTQSEAAARIALSRCVGVPPRGSKTTNGFGSPPAISRRSIISPLRATAGQWIREAGLPSR